MTTRLDYPDLGATVEVGEVPEALLDQLPDLYGSLFSTREWFAVFDDWRPTGVCILRDPRHIIVFGRTGGVVEIYNKTFVIAPADAERACRAIFRAFPFAHRVRLHVLFPPRELRLPRRVIAGRDHMMLALPETVEEYESSLGRSTRRNLRLYENRLRRACPDARTEVIVPGERAAELLDLIVTWKIARFSARNRTTYWETRPRQYDLLLELLRHTGEAQVTTIDGRVVAVILLFSMGHGICAQEWAHDPEYDRFHLGFVALRSAIHLAVERGATTMDLLWDNEHYKERFGARRVRSSVLSVFPSQTARLRSLGEAREVATRSLGREGRRRYWQARHATGRLIRGVATHASRTKAGPEGDAS